MLSGGNRRIFELLKRGKSEGIDFIIITSLQSYKNAKKMFPDYAETLSNYMAYVKQFKERRSPIPGLNQVFIYFDMFRSALLVSKIAVDEDADLIVGGEDLPFLTSYLAARFCSRPWTAVFQPGTDLLQRSSSISSLNAFNILKFVSGKRSAKRLSLRARIGVALQLLVQLKIAQKSLMLSVSPSVVEELHFLNPKINFQVIQPGNGIDLEKFAAKSDSSLKYDAIFFGRLIPEKGLHDLPVIWKYVTERIPKAVLGVAGIVEDQRFVNGFLALVSDLHLSQNIVFLGEQNEDALKNLVGCSRLTLNPSLVDSFSLVTLESLACGTPVVAYNIPAIKHNFGKCDAVIRCPVEDRKSMAEKAILIISDKNLRAILSRKGRKYSVNFDWKDVVNAEKQAYFKVIKRFRAKSTRSTIRGRIHLG